MLNVSPATLDNPTFIDESLLEFQFVLQDKLSWLNTAYGKSEKRKDNSTGTLSIFPAIYSDGRTKKEYIKLFPDSHLGNFSFFTISEGYVADIRRSRQGKVQFDFGLIFWFDFRTIYPNNWQNKSTQNVMELVLDVLKTTRFRRSSVELSEIFEEPDNIYAGFTHRDIDQKTHYRPFGGFRINGSVTFRTRCSTKFNSPQCGIIPLGKFKDVNHAKDIGGLKADDYFETSLGNSYGLPEGVLIQVDPTTSYDTDAAAMTGGVQNDECFALSSGNVFGLPPGTIKIIPTNTNTFINDREAGQSGVPVDGQYALSMITPFSFAKGLIKKRIT